MPASVTHPHAHTITPLQVLNHRCAQHQDENGVWNKYGGRLAWDQRAIVGASLPAPCQPAPWPTSLLQLLPPRVFLFCILIICAAAPGDDPNFRGRGNRSSGDAFTAAPNIDHSQDFVKRDLQGGFCRAICTRLWGLRMNSKQRHRAAALDAQHCIRACVPPFLSPPALPRAQSGWCGCARISGLTAGALTLSRASTAPTCATTWRRRCPSLPWVRAGERGGWRWRRLGRGCSAAVCVSRPKLEHCRCFICRQLGLGTLLQSPPHPRPCPCYTLPPFPQASTGTR